LISQYVIGALIYFSAIAEKNLSSMLNCQELFWLFATFYF